jgi:hypothetical protein
VAQASVVVCGYHAGTQTGYSNDLVVTFGADGNIPLSHGIYATALGPEAGGLGQYYLMSSPGLWPTSMYASGEAYYGLIGVAFKSSAVPLLPAPTLSFYYVVYTQWSWEGTMGEGDLVERQESTDGTNFTTIDYTAIGDTTPGNYYRIRVVDADHNPISEFSEPLHMPAPGYAAWASSNGIEWTWDYEGEDHAGWSIECSPDGVNDWIEVDTTGSGAGVRSYGNVTPGYYYRVDPTGSYLYSQVVQVPLPFPSVWVTTSGDYPGSLDWTYSYTEPASWDIEYSTDGVSGWTWVANCGGGNFIDEANTIHEFRNYWGITPGYYYRVCNYSAQNHSDAVYVPGE